jgi:hypothetical protein
MPLKKKQIQKTSILTDLKIGIKKAWRVVNETTGQYLARRPHRSFRITRRRDYVRSLELPGYWAFSAYVRRTLWAERKTFLLLGLAYALLTAVMVGIASQDTYTTLTDTIRETGDDVFDGDWGALEKAGLLFVAAMSGGINSSLSDIQQVYAILIALMSWLTTVWLLRSILAGHKVKLRDGIYNSGAPLLSTFLVGLALVVQLIPFAIALIGYSAATASGLLSGGVEAMLFWIAAGLLTLVSLYWVTSTAIALVIVTLPGMYPMQALRTAGDVVIGRRVRILLRLLWMVLGVGIAWVAVMIPVILLDTWIKGIWPAIEWVPVIPVSLLGLSSVTVIWAASYIYLLYRRIVADDAAPA